MASTNEPDDWWLAFRLVLYVMCCRSPKPTVEAWGDRALRALAPELNAWARGR